MKLAQNRLCADMWNLSEIFDFVRSRPATVPVAYLGGYWAMAPFGEIVFFTIVKNRKTWYGPLPSVSALVDKQKLPPPPFEILNMPLDSSSGIHLVRAVHYIIAFVLSAMLHLNSSI